MLLFWGRNYGSASYQALLSAMGVPRPQSLIAAFGSKAKLFATALGRYWDHRLAPVLACLGADEPIAAFVGLLKRRVRRRSLRPVLAMTGGRARR